MVGDLVDGKKPKSNFDSLVSLGKHCSNLEKRASDAERELKKLKLLSFMSEKIGETLTGVITGVESFGLFVQGIEIPAEGLVSIEALPNDNYSYERYSRTLSGSKKKNQFRLGDQIQVEVANVDLDKRLLEFNLLGVKPGGNRPARPKSGSSKRKPDSGKDKSPRSSREKPAFDKTKPKGKSKKKSKARIKPKRSKDKSNQGEEEFVWEEVRKSGKTRKQREAAKEKRRKPSRKTESGKSRKTQAKKKKAQAASKKSARKKKVAAARAKQKKKGKKRKKS